MDAFLRALVTATSEDLTMLVQRHPEVTGELNISAGEISRTKVTCPVTDSEVLVPCTLKKCAMYTELSKCHNCALVYQKNQPGEFTSLDVAIVFRRPHDEVKETIAHAMTKLRRQVRDGVDTPFVFLPISGVCTACESPIEEDPHVLDGCDYCSVGCAGALPPVKARACYMPESGSNSSPR